MEERGFIHYQSFVKKQVINMKVAVQSACVMMCATELCNETSYIKLRSSYLQTFSRNLSHHSEASGDKNIIFFADILLLYVFIINEKLHKYQTPPSSCNLYL